MSRMVLPSLATGARFDMSAELILSSKAYRRTLYSPLAGLIPLVLSAARRAVYRRIERVNDPVLKCDTYSGDSAWDKDSTVYHFRYQRKYSIRRPSSSL